MIGIKKWLLLFLALLFCGGIISLLYKISMPQIEIKVEGTHNPLANKVTLNGKFVSPQGDKGRLYAQKVRAGAVNVSLFGPFSVSYKEEVKVSLFSKKTIILTTTDRTLEGIIKEAVSGEKITASNIRTFNNEGVLIANITVDGKAKEDSYPTILLYNTGKNEWEDISNNYVNNRDLYSFSKEVTTYFGELASD